ncbi:hypothetical protein ACOZ4N_10845 [Halorientalis pallida]|uniref:hypothetical protein n=1 Tax=Halorientalis pallida TaxID=2479928 RepID=UPI003C703AA2
MVVDDLVRTVGLDALAPPLQVLVATVGVGLSVKVGALALWQRTDDLFAPTTYLKVCTLLAASAVVVVVGVRRGVFQGPVGVGAQTVYALVLAKVVEQTYVLLRH